MRPGSEGPAVATGIVIFFLLILIELIASRRLGRTVYRLRNAISNLGTGAVHGLANAYYAAALVGVYEALRSRVALHDFSHMSWWSYVLLVLFVDFLFYWNHRLLHHNKYMWCAHVVHHHSTDYNYTVSLRVSILQVWYAAIFGLPLALAGFPAAAVWPIFIADKFYQFWIHTRLLGRLGPLEWVLVTPHHHSVHHATNPEYIDRNFGGMFILWDRLFGTFEERRAEPVYGIDNLLPTFNPVMANVEPWQRLWRKAHGRPETTAPVPKDAQPRRLDDADAEGLNAPESLSPLAGGLRLFAPVTVLLTFLYTQSSFSMEWVIATLIAMVWLYRLGQFLDREHLTPALDVGAVIAGAGLGSAAFALGWIRVPVAIAIAAGCVLLTVELLLQPIATIRTRALSALRS